MGLLAFKIAFKIKHLKSNHKGFSLVELVIVIAIIGTLSTVAYVGIKKVQQGGYNDKVLSDLIAISNSLEQYSADHFGKYPTPLPGDNQNINCYLADATYSHDCTTPAEFIAGRIDNALLTKRYLQEIPVDPYTNSRYAYGVSLDGRFFQVAGLWRNDDGSYSSRTAGNLEKGYQLPSLIRAYDGPNFVVNKGNFLPYHPTEKQLIATLQNYTGVTVTNDQQTAVIATGAPIKIFKDWRVIVQSGTAELYFGEGSISYLDQGTDLTLERMEIAEDDEDNFISKVRVKLDVGQLWSKISRLAAQSEFHVETTNGIAGVRGTEFGISSGGAIQVASGEVFFAPGAQALSVSQKNQIDKNNPPSGAQLIDSTTNLVQPGTRTYSDIALNNSIVPRIVSASRSSLTVENLYVTLRLPSTDPRTVLVDAIEVTTGGTALPTLFPISATDRTNDYTLTLPGSTVVDRLFVRFSFGQPPNQIFSAPSFPTLTISAASTQSLTAAQIYDVKPPRLKLLSPSRYIAQGRPGSTFQFLTGVTIADLSQNATSTSPLINFSATPQSVCRISSPSNALTATFNGRAGWSVPGQITLDAQSIGQCQITVQLALSDGSTLEDTTAVDILDPTGLIVAATGGGSPTIDTLYFVRTAGLQAPGRLQNNTDFILIQAPALPGGSAVPTLNDYQIMADLSSGPDRPILLTDNVTCTINGNTAPLTSGGTGLQLTINSNTPAGLNNISCQTATGPTTGTQVNASVAVSALRKSLTPMVLSGNNVFVMYSDTTAGVDNWNNASQACQNSTEAGFNDWDLPVASFLANNTERRVWCSQSGTTCLNMPQNRGSIWGETDPGNTSNAFRVTFTPGNQPQSVVMSQNHGYRCVRAAQ